MLFFYGVGTFGIGDDVGALFSGVFVLLSIEILHLFLFVISQNHRKPSPHSKGLCTNQWSRPTASADHVNRTSTFVQGLPCWASARVFLLRAICW